MAKLNVQGLSNERLKELQFEIKAELGNRYPERPPFDETEAARAFNAKRVELSKALDAAQETVDKATEALFEAEEALANHDMEYSDAETDYLDEFEG